MSARDIAAEYARMALHPVYGPGWQAYCKARTLELDALEVDGVRVFDGVRARYLDLVRGAA